MQFEKIAYVVFDLDGLILETETIYAKIFSDIAHMFGKEYTPEVRLKILGTSSLETDRIFLEELNIPITREELRKEFSSRVAKELQDPEFMPGAEKLIKHLAEHNIPMAIATSSATSSYQAKTKHRPDIFKLFDHVVCGLTDPEVKQGKPAPDIFLVCASRFPEKPDPSQVLVLEDSPNGVKGALAAGMKVVLVAAGIDVTEELRKSATLVLSSLQEFQPECFCLPSYNA